MSDVHPTIGIWDGNSSRSMNTDLRTGATDGKYRKLRPDTGGSTLNDEANLRDRAGLHPDYGYGVHVVASDMRMPDGTPA